MAKAKKQSLTPAETSVYEALKKGKVTAEIAAERGVSEQSVYNHIGKIRRKNWEIPEPSPEPATEPTGTGTDSSLTLGASNGRGDDGDDVALLMELAGPIAADATALLDGLRARDEELGEDISAKEALIRDEEAKIKVLHERRERLQERIGEAAQVAETVRPLVAA